MASLLSDDQVLQSLLAQNHPQRSGYRAFYSSWLGGITTKPHLMVVPMDDHLVHRGDGVFEAIKFIEGRVYLYEAHIQRLLKSAQSIGMQHSYTSEGIWSVIQDCVKASGLSSGLLRLFLSRGPGGFTTNPYESLGAQLYVVVQDLVAPADDKYLRGVEVGFSAIPAKESWFAQIKSCNYLVNVLMKKEAVDCQKDFMIGFDSQGFVTESSTENIMILDSKNTLVYPRLEQILKGTTMVRAAELALTHGVVSQVESRDISRAELLDAQEVMMVGTTLDVLPVTKIESKTWAGAGPISQKLLHLLREDQKVGSVAKKLS